MAIPRIRYQKKRQRKSGTTGTRFKQGIYIPINEEKYRPSIDKHMNNQDKGMIYRSSWELGFARYLDQSDHIKMWASEPFAIPYISPKDGQPHRYYVDFVFETVPGKKYLVEIKPAGQTKNPINLAKWEAAEAYAAGVNAEFVVVTEKELKKWGII